MTNQERIQIRIAKDKYRRAKRREQRNAQYDSFDNVITIQHYTEALKACRRGVSWKGSVQDYIHTSIIQEIKTINSLKSGVLPPLRNTRKVKICERGKDRIIFPVAIGDRMTQRVLCDYSLIPVLAPTLIYDNGASLKGKGVDFTRKRIEKHLREALREFGPDFYALVFDFKSYFDSIPHETCLDVLKKNFSDKWIIGLTMGIIRSYHEPDIRKIEDEDERNAMMLRLKKNKLNGICLGSQISQVMALAVPNKFDHFIKCKKSVHHYIRYMDDGIVLSNDKEFLKALLVEAQEVAESLGLHFNLKKTHIVKMSKGFTFMKVRYRISKDGRIIKTLVHSGIVRERRKLKKLHRKILKGELTLDDAYNSMQSWLAHSKIAKSYHSVKSMLKLYDKLFGGYKLTKKYFKKEGNKSHELLQADRWQDYRWDRYDIRFKEVPAKA